MGVLFFCGQPAKFIKSIYRALGVYSEVADSVRRGGIVPENDPHASI